MAKIIYPKYASEPSSNGRYWYVSEFYVTNYNKHGEPIDGGYVPLTDILYHTEQEAKEEARKLNEESNQSFVKVTISD